MTWTLDPMPDIEWEKIESLFHDALALPKGQREAFLEQVCHSDRALHGKVSHLLSCHCEEEQFQKEADIAQLLGESELEDAVLEEGQRFGRYEVVKLVGRGGMGEVYAARDSHLKRKVALKILPKGFFTGPEEIERLRREAEIISSLAAANIVTVFDFDEQDDMQFMVTEFVEGVSLRELIGRLPVAQAMHYARQVGEALKVAHAKGIIHGDIKPENIMVRASDDCIKVLDFGLAKLAPASPETGKSLYERLIARGDASLPGLAGTVSYMSPEQVREQPVDERTDIWSWGVVFYEMLAGARPFSASTTREIFGDILHAEPKPPTGNAGFNRIVTKALSKDLAGRYATMAEALEDMVDLRAPNPDPDFHNSLGKLFRWLFQRPRTQWMIGSVVLSLLGLAPFEAYRIIKPVSHNTFHNARIKHLTTGGNVVCASYSPDGNYVSYVTREGQGEALRLLQVRTNTDLEKVSSTGAEYLGVTFSKDSQFVYYVRSQHDVGFLYRMPLVGGSEKLVAEDIDSSITFSPDGRRFAFVRSDPAAHSDSLIMRSLDRETETTLLTLRQPEYFMPAPSAPNWSPDGRLVLGGIYTDSTSGAGGIKMVAVDVENGQVRYLGPLPWQWMGKAIWLRDGTSIEVAAAAPDSNRAQILEVAWPQGTISQITNDLAHYSDLDLTADSQNMVATGLQRSSNLWLVQLARSDQSRRITQTVGRFIGVTWTSSGKLVSQTDIGDRPDLWSIDPVTGDHQQLTDDAYVEYDPTTSPDGRYLVYSSNRDGIFHLWRSNLQGGAAVRVTASSTTEMEPSITPDSQWVVFTSTRAGFRALWKAPLAGTGGAEAVQVSRFYARRPVVSPDGTQIACEYKEDPAKGWSTAILRITGELVRVLPDISAETPVRWSADGKALLYVATQSGVSNIWLQPVDDSVPRQLTHFGEELIFAFAPSPDGKVLACVRGTLVSDLVLLQAAK